MARTGRPRTFDTDEALARARDLFWSRGYGGTSVQDLVDALGVERGSLYGAFGDKRRLYLQAVELYARLNREQFETLLATDPVLPTIRQMLLDPAALTGAPELPGGRRRGCLLGNTAAELLPEDADATKLVAAAYQALVGVLTAALTRAQATGEVVDSAAPRAQAEMLLLLFQGSALVNRAQTDRELFGTGIDAALDALRPR